MQLLKMSEWEDNFGYFHCADTSNLGQGSACWWLPARMMNMKPADYVKWVVDNYNPTEVKRANDCSVVWFVWKSQADMRRYKNAINKIAREKNFLI